MAIEFKTSIIFIIPGVPKEMKGMLKEEIIPCYIEPNFNRTLSLTTILTTGIYESKLYDILEKKNS